jgi:diguanylate cyclase (GGDEF)-like protein
MQSALMHVEDESAMRAGRIRALWRMASEPSGAGDERFGGTLEIAVRALRPNRPMFGSLSHLVGNTIVFDATSWSLENPAPAALAGAVYPGARMAIERTLHGRLLDAGHTLAIDDVAAEDAHHRPYPDVRMGCFIGTPVTIGGRTHFVAFYSPESMRDQPFAEDDIAFVDVVAAFFAGRFTQQVQFEQIQFQIEHDALTGLENRIQFRKAVREEIRAGRPFTAAFIDLDGFRFVNERDGHEMGDEVLVEVATELAVVVPGNRVARMSGDEFGVLIPGAGSVEEASRALKPYVDLFLKPFQTGDRLGPRLLDVGATIGAARFPDDGSSAEDLMRRADVALAVAKTRGGSAMLIFDAAMEAIVEDARVRFDEISDAIAQDQLALVYQPTFDLADRHITGAEALVRSLGPSDAGQAIAGRIHRTRRAERLDRWSLALGHATPASRPARGR